MSTLPFLLSVADELDNINSQSYMDDFGLGFHPHRQYYRTPTIQLSLPASTDWMQQERQQRYRSHKFYDETQNNLQTTGEENADGGIEGDGDGDGDDDYTDADANADEGKMSSNAYKSRMARYDSQPTTSSSACGSGSSRQKYASALNSNRHELVDVATGGRPATAITSGDSRQVVGSNDGADDDDDDNIDNSVRMYNLSKKCCKNYHRHAVETNAKDVSGHAAAGVGGSAAGSSSYRLHSKCMEGNNSSSDESLQKVSSSIEFLTCFLLKRSRASSSSSSSKNTSGRGSSGSNSKKP